MGGGKKKKKLKGKWREDWVTVVMVVMLVSVFFLGQEGFCFMCHDV